MRDIKIFGSADEGTIAQADNCLVEAEAVLLMGDNHRGYGMPVGGVAVYKNKISPVGVGFDIACGNKAVKTNLKLSNIEHKKSELADTIFSNLSFGMGLNNDTKVEHELFDSSTWDEVSFLKGNQSLKEKAKNQLGTIGSGNHYVDVFFDEDETIWIGVHFGSRGLGHTIASHFMTLAGDNTNIMDETPHTLDVNSQNGRDYIACMKLAGEYAYAGRDWVCQSVVEILGGEIVQEVHNHHNFAWQETHNGEKYWIVRKGATPAFPGQLGFVGSTMGDKSVILMGIDSKVSKESFYSTVHGAGRVMSRTQASGKWKKITETRTKPDGTEYQFKKRIRMGGLIDFDSVKQEMKSKGIELRGAGADEAPGAYKKLDEVLRYHAGTVQIMYTLTPIIVCMAGNNEFDPYKD
jgi:tRNA-splicing ligase RtcB